MLIFIGFLLFLIWIFLPSNPSENHELKVDLKNKIQDDFFNIQELHWTHMPLTYSFNNLGCSEVQINHFLKGISIIENLTEGKVSFIETNEEGDLQVNCIDRDFLISELTNCEEVVVQGNPTSINWYEGFLDREEKRFISAARINQTEQNKTYKLCSINLNEVGFNFDYDVLGEGGITNNSENLIIRGEVNLYQGFEKFTTCTFPSKEIHEVFHSFGFDHSYEPYFDPYYGYADWSYAEDIMFPYNYCQYQKEVQEKYVNCLNNIYSNGEFQGDCSEINFFRTTSECEEGWYEATNSDYLCCPEPNMFIGEDGYCY
jgi:hypothetical protein